MPEIYVVGFHGACFFTRESYASTFAEPTPLGSLHGSRQQQKSHASLAGSAETAAPSGQKEKQGECVIQRCSPTQRAEIGGSTHALTWFASH